MKDAAFIGRLLDTLLQEVKFGLKKHKVILSESTKVEEILIKGGKIEKYFSLGSTGAVLELGKMEERSWAICGLAALVRYNEENTNI